MSTAFKHPLARDAQIWETGGSKSKPSRVLVIITTLELKEGRKHYKADKVERLSEAAKQWVVQSEISVDDFMLISRPKSWDGDKD